MFRVGFIGLGTMGMPMASRLVAHGLDVFAYNRSAKRSVPAGMSLTDRIHEAFTTRDAVILMLSDGNALREAVFHTPSALAAAGKGTLIVNMSTVGLEETKEFADVCHRAGMRYMDAPVIGSVGPATAGALTIVAGGSEEDFAMITPVFNILGKSSFHMGDIGRGTIMKLLVNGHLAVSMQMMGECLALAKKADLNRELVLSVFEESSVWSALLAAKRSLLLSETFPAAFALRHMVKDLSLAVELADTYNSEDKLIQAARRTYSEALQAGFGDADMASITQYLLS